jgi:surfeit locus 1 family protein
MLRTLQFRHYFLITLSLVVTVAFVRLGIWQVHRLYQRRDHNAMTERRLADPPIPVLQLPRDSGSVHYRRAYIRGTYDYAHELVLTDRTHDGSPGVDILTPVRLTGSDSAVLVNRGWIYSPDGVHVNLAPWREGDFIDAVGYIQPFGAKRQGVARSPSRANAYRWVDMDVLRAALPYQVLPYIVVLQGDSTPLSTVPPRISAPPLDEGPHLNYAIQWFSFALIAVAGTVLFIRKDACR